MPGDGGGGGDGSSGHSDSDVDGDGGVSIRGMKAIRHRYLLPSFARIQNYFIKYTGMKIFTKHLCLSGDRMFHSSGICLFRILICIFLSKSLCFSLFTS